MIKEIIQNGKRRKIIVPINIDGLFNYLRPSINSNCKNSGAKVGIIFENANKKGTFIYNYNWSFAFAQLFEVQEFRSCRSSDNSPNSPYYVQWCLIGVMSELLNFCNFWTPFNLLKLSNYNLDVAILIIEKHCFYSASIAWREVG